MSLLDAPPVDDSVDDQVVERAPGDPDGPSKAARGAAWIAVLALVVAAVTIPRSGQDSFGSDTFGRVLAGVVEQRDGDGWERIPVGEEVPSIATIRTRTDAAEIEVRGGTTTLARGTDISIRGDELQLDNGSVLLEADRPYSVVRGVVEGRGRGTWRVDAAGTSRFGVYRGGIAVSEADGREVAVPSLRQITLVDGELGGEVIPLRYLTADAWDRRLLSDALAIDDLLDDVASNLQDTYGVALQDASFYGDFAVVEGALAGSLERLAPRAAGGRFGPPAPTLVATVIADLLVRDARLSLETALDEITSLRRAGATWGLVVRDHDLGLADVRSGLDRALRRRAVSVDEGTATPPRGSATARTTPPTDDATPGEDPTESPDPGTEPEPGPTAGPSEPPAPPEDDPGPLNPAEETIRDLGSLLDPVPGASDAADDVADAVDTIDDLLPPPPGASPESPSAQPSDRPSGVQDLVDGLLGGS